MAETRGSEIVVFWARSRVTCDGCGEDLGKGALIRLEDRQAFCPDCADLDHLVFLPSGDAALTRRASRLSGLRAACRLRDAERRERLDQEYVTRFAGAVRARYPSCPQGEEREMAEHACRQHSGRVGRSAAAKGLDPVAVDLAVRAHVRHACTRYDELLMAGRDRGVARAEVEGEVEAVLARWQSGGAVSADPA